MRKFLDRANNALRNIERNVDSLCCKISPSYSNRHYSLDLCVILVEEVCSLELHVVLLVTHNQIGGLIDVPAPHKEEMLIDWLYRWILSSKEVIFLSRRRPSKKREGIEDQRVDLSGYENPLSCIDGAKT